MMAVIDAIVADLRGRADELSKWGANEQARAVRHAANRVENQWKDALTTSLTLKEAAQESGYSPDHLGKLVRDNTLPNAGSPNAPRIRRKDLPRKPGHRVPVASGNGDSVPSKAQIAGSVLDSDRGEDDD